MTENGGKNTFESTVNTLVQMDWDISSEQTLVDIEDGLEEEENPSLNEVSHENRKLEEQISVKEEKIKEQKTEIPAKEESDDRAVTDVRTKKEEEEQVEDDKGLLDTEMVDEEEEQEDEVSQAKKEIAEMESIEHQSESDPAPKNV